MRCIAEKRRNIAAHAIYRNACTYCTMWQEVNIIHLPIYTNFKNMNKNA